MERLANRAEADGNLAVAVRASEILGQFCGLGSVTAGQGQESQEVVPAIGLVMMLERNAS